MNSNSHGLIDKKAFEEYHEKEKQKTILIYKVIVALFIIVNIVFIGFVITYNVQIFSLKTDINTISDDITKQTEINNQLMNSANKKIVNLFSNASVNKNLILDIFQSTNEFETLLNWTGIDKSNLVLCFKSSYDNEDPHLMRRYCDGEHLIVIIQAENGRRFGGYISGVRLTDLDVTQYKSDSAFLFSLDNKTKYPIRNKENAFFVQRDSFFSFGHDLVINEGFKHGKVNTANFPYDYGEAEDTIAEFNGGLTSFDIEEMEILAA